MADAVALIAALVLDFAVVAATDALGGAGFEASDEHPARLATAANRHKKRGNLVWKVMDPGRSSRISGWM